MENRKYENRIVYAALILVLAVLAALVVVTGITARRARRLPDSDTSADTQAMAPRDTAEHQTPARDTEKPAGIFGKKDDKNDETTAAPKTEPPVTETPKPPTVDVDVQPTLPQFTQPADGVVSKSHSETALVYSMTMDDYRTHTGVDIATSAGADVRAAAAGIVTEVWDDPFWGVCANVSHEGDAVSTYRNLSTETLGSLTVGRTVAAGEVIGTVGESALYEIADEPHLHFELKISGASVDPCDYIAFAGADSLEG